MRCRRLLLTTLISYVALAIAIWAVPGITAGGIPSVVAAVVLIALLNSLFRPIVLWLAVPLGTLAVGVLATVLQFVVFIVVASVVPGIHLSGLHAAIEATLVFSVVNVSISWMIALGEDESYFSHLVQLMISQGATPSDLPGVVIVQIDGLSRPVLVNQIRAGRVPTMPGGCAPRATVSPPGNASCHRRPRAARLASCWARTTGSRRSAGTRRRPAG